MRRTIILFVLWLGIGAVMAEDMPEGYYNRANGTKDAELKDSLKRIIRKHTVIPYGNGANSSWGVFYYSDRDEEGYCMDMYCDTWYKFSSPGTAVTGCNIEHSFAKSWWGIRELADVSALGEYLQQDARRWRKPRDPTSAPRRCPPRPAGWIWQQWCSLDIRVIRTIRVRRLFRHFQVGLGIHTGIAYVGIAEERLHFLLQQPQVNLHLVHVGVGEDQ